MNTYPEFPAWYVSQDSLTVAIKSLVWWAWLLIDLQCGRTFPLLWHYRFLPTTDDEHGDFQDKNHHLFLSIYHTITGCDLCHDLSNMIPALSQHISCRSDVCVFPSVILSKEIAFIESFCPEKHKLFLLAVSVSGSLIWKQNRVFPSGTQTGSNAADYIMVEAEECRFIRWEAAYFSEGWSHSLWRHHAASGGVLVITLTCKSGPSDRWVLDACSLHWSEVSPWAEG